MTSAPGETGRETGHESRSQPLISDVRDDMVDTARARHVHGIVCRTIIDNKDFDDIDSWNIAWQVLERRL
jgi:hypothetical protein